MGYSRFLASAWRPLKQQADHARMRFVGPEDREFGAGLQPWA